VRVLSASARGRPTSVLPVPHAMINWPRSEAVRTLRRIGDARNAFPIHTRSERLLEAFPAGRVCGRPTRCLPLLPRIGAFSAR
jgi:hypothetical protein